MSTVKLSDVAIESRDSLKEKDKSLPVVGLEHLIPEQINLTDWNIGQDNTFTKIFEKGDVLFGRRRAYLKKAAVAPCKGICSGDITVIRAREDKILPELLPFVIQNDIFFNYAVGKSAGSLSPRVKWEHLANYEFNLPELDEQKKLAEILWQIVATMESYKKLLAKTDEMVKAKFVEMFGTIEKTKWKVVNISTTLAGIVSNGFFAKKEEYNDSGNISVLGVTNIVNTLYSKIENLPRANASTSDIKKFSVKYGDILFCRSSLVAEGIGKASVVPKNTPADTLFECHVIRLPLNLELCNPEFLQIQLSLPFCRNQILAQAKTVTMTTIGQSEILKTNIILPPIELQQKFAIFIQKSEESKVAIQSSLNSLSAVYKKIIAENLGGSN